MKERQWQFDNAKAILVLLVVFGHFVEPAINNEMYRGFYTFIYLFHMHPVILVKIVPAY